MKRKLVLVAFLTALLAGCGMTPQQKVYSAYRTYTSAAMLLVHARRAGEISDAQWVQIVRLDAVAYAALQSYELAVEAGLPGEAEWAAFNAAIDKLLELYQRLDEPADKPAPDPNLSMEV